VKDENRRTHFHPSSFKFHPSPKRFRFLLGLAPDGGCQAASSLKRRCALTLSFASCPGTIVETAPFHPYHFCKWRFIFCCPVPSRRFRAARSPLATVLPCGVRTFLASALVTAARPSSPLFIGNYTKTRKSPWHEYSFVRVLAARLLSLYRKCFPPQSNRQFCHPCCQRETCPFHDPGQDEARDENICDP